MTWTLYKYDKEDQKSVAIKSGEGLDFFKSFAMDEVRKNGHSGVWQDTGNEDYNLFTFEVNSIGALLYSIRRTE